MGESRKRSAARANPGIAGPRGNALLLDEAALAALMAEWTAGISSAALVQLFNDRDIPLTEATFRKYVQAGAVPRSFRVGTKGTHGSRGIYPAAVIGRVALVKRRLAEGMTLEDIAAAISLRGAFEQIEEQLSRFFEDASGRVGGLPEGERRATEKQLGQARQAAAGLVKELDLLERRLVAPVLREAKARAFASGASGGADELL